MQSLTAAALLHLWVCLTSAVAMKSVPRIDGHLRSTVTLPENATRRFRCVSDGWRWQHPPLIIWYLNGEKQSSQQQTPPNGSFTLRAHRWDRDLVCVASDPQSGRSYNASITLDVQYQPEIVRVSAHYSQTADPGLSLVLFALVRSNPPATLTWADQRGLLVANASDFLVLDSQSYPWLTNHTLRVSASGLSGNVSLNASNSLGATQGNLTLAELLQTRVEVPLMGIVTGGATGFVALLVLTLLLLFLLQKNKGKVLDAPMEIIIHKSESARLQPDSRCLPRDYVSLPANLKLNDTSALSRAAAVLKPPSEEDKDNQDLLAAYAARGFNHFPMVGYIYKVSSTSSDEVWL